MDYKEKREKEIKRLNKMLGTSAYEPDELPVTLRRKAFEVGSIYVAKRHWYDKKENRIRTTTRPVLVVGRFGDGDNDIHVIELNRNSKSSKEASLIKKRNPFVTDFTQGELKDYDLYEESWLDAGKIKAVHSEELLLPRKGSIRETNPEKFQKIMTDMRESLLETITQEEIFANVKDTQREMDAIHSRLNTLQNRKEETRTPVPAKSTDGLQQKKEPMFMEQVNDSWLEPGKLYLAERKYYDKVKNAFSTKTRPILLIGTFNDGEALTVDLTRRKIEADTNHVKFLRPERQPFCHEIRPEAYTKLNVTDPSWMDAGKPQVIQIKTIRYYPIGDMKKEYPEKYHKILADMRESLLQSTTQNEVFVSQSLVDKEITLVKERLRKLEAELIAVKEKEQQKRQAARQSSGKNKYAKLKEEKNIGLTVK